MSRPESESLETIDLNGGLKKLSQMIMAEQRNLIPHPHNLAKDVLRPDILWRKYVRMGILLTNGGADVSLFSTREVADKYSTIDYSQYRSDRPQSTMISSPEMKNFLCEEGLMSAENKDQLFTEFSLGSHEAFTRVARCIYKEGENTGLLYPTGGYGLLIRSIALMKPTSYNVHLVDVDRKNGERILPQDLERAAKANPKAKTFYLESKNTCGAVYSEEELEEMVKICKKHDLFFILDTAHNNMEFEPENKFPDVAKLCLRRDHKKFAILTTGSKTYGLERGRVGFMVLGDEALATELNRNLFQTVGALGDWHAEVAKMLVSTPLEKKQEFLETARAKHRLNRSVMIGYVEGVNSPNIDEDLRAQVAAEIPPQYQEGIEGLSLVYKPEAGIQLKVSMDGLRNKYFSNIRMFNSEILGYALSTTCGVATLNSYQIMDPEGSGMRLSFSIKEDVHRGMQKTHDFIKALTNEPTPNPYLPDVVLVEDMIFPTQEKMDKIVAASRLEVIDAEDSLRTYKKAIRAQMPKHILRSATDELLSDSVHEAARGVQGLWPQHSSAAGELEVPSARPAAEPSVKHLKTAAIVDSRVETKAAFRAAHEREATEEVYNPGRN